MTRGGPATAIAAGQDFALHNRVRITAGPHAGKTGVVTVVKGPKTREVRLDAGFMLWNVKLARLVLESPKEN